MKKQFFSLLIVVFAISISNAFGQGAKKYSDPIPLVCPNDALHPIAGKSYSYIATGTPSGGTWHFWATKDPNFIQTAADGKTTTFNSNTALTKASGDLIDTSTDYNDPTNSDGNVDIIWSSKILAGTSYQGKITGKTPTFVTAYYKAPSGSCSDNFKVFEINPLNGFTVDIKNLDPTAFATKLDYGVITETCPDVVRTATYSNGSMHYNYGTNYLYYEFVAANFSNYWVPTFSITAGLGATQAAASYEYTFSSPDTWGTTAPTWTALESGKTKIPVDASISSTENGVSIFVRVKIANNQFENLAGQTIAMALDGQNAEGLWDVVNNDCAKPDPNAADGVDTANQTITARPTITTATPVLSTAPPSDVISGDNQ